MAVAAIDVKVMIDDLLALEQEQSNCMFQLSMMLAHIALEPVAEEYKDDISQALLRLIRSKPKSNVVQLGGARFADGFSRDRLN